MQVLNTVIQIKQLELKNNNLVGNFKLLPHFHKEIEKIDDLNYKVTLYFSVESTIENPFPVNLKASLMGLFTFDPKSLENDIENFLNIPAVQILYPHLRSVISSVTSSSYIQPLLLPFVDPRIFKTL